jgi:hypothetical protein
MTVVRAATPLPASPTRGEVPGGARFEAVPQSQALPGTLRLVGRAGEGVARRSLEF